MGIANDRPATTHAALVSRSRLGDTRELRPIQIANGRTWFLLQNVGP